MRPLSLVRRIDLMNIDFGVVDEAVKILKNGGVLLYPTDTLYGLGCDAFNAKAVQRIYDIKKRESGNPFLILTNSFSSVKNLVEEIPLNARRLAEAFWPGPITLVFRAKNHLPRNIVSKDWKIGIRIPNHEFCQRLCERAGVPIVSTSANISGQDHVYGIHNLENLFTGKVDLVIDAGDCFSVVASTIIDITGNIPVILREGVISRSTIEIVIGKILT